MNRVSMPAVDVPPSPSPCYVRRGGGRMRSKVLTRLHHWTVQIHKRFNENSVIFSALCLNLKGALDDTTNNSWKLGRCGTGYKLRARHTESSDV
jgi:hypothetical protein